MALRDLWGSAPAPSPELAASLADLDRLEAARLELASPARTLARLLGAAFGAAPVERPFEPDDFLAARLLKAWGEGVPAIRVVPPALDQASLHSRGLALCDALKAENPGALPLQAALRTDPARVGAWADWNLSGRADDYAADLSRLGLEPALATSLLRLALLPALAVWASASMVRLPAGVWNRGDCPICGEPPVLAESRGLEQRRHLRCGLCAADWPGERFRCHSCGTTDHRAFHTRYVEGERDRVRLIQCDSCGARLKVVSTLAPLSAPGLLVAELATVHLDGIED